MRIVRVIWLDALAIAEWTTRGEPVLRQQCETVGFLVEDTRDHVVIATTVSEDQFNGAMQIPKSMIEVMVDIREATN